MLTSVVTLLLLLAAGLIAVGLWTLFVRRPSAAVWALIVCVIGTHDIVPPLALQITFAGFNVFPLDVVTGVMLAIGVAGLVKQGYPRPYLTRSVSSSRFSAFTFSGAPSSSGCRQRSRRRVPGSTFWDHSCMRPRRHRTGHAHPSDPSSRRPWSSPVTSSSGSRSSGSTAPTHRSRSAVSSSIRGHS